MNLISYWQNPDDNMNQPEQYFLWNRRTQHLLSTFEKYIKKDASIIELGMNVGRNLNGLWQAGYRNLAGIDVNANAQRLGETAYPALFSSAEISTVSIEDMVLHTSKKYDCVFTMAVLTHLPYESNYAIQEIETIVGDYLILYEYQHTDSWKHFPRNYEKIFTASGALTLVNRQDNLVEFDLGNVDLLVFRRKDGA